MIEKEQLQAIANQLRIDLIRATAEAGSGHATSSLSAADIVAVLFANHLRYDFDNPKSVHNDRFILSKGHASPLLYAAYKAAGIIDDAEFMTYRKPGSRLEGHPTPQLPWVDVATGSLGFGLPVGVGTAISGRLLHQLPFQTWVLCGDSELSEGSVWEAAEAAASYELGNLTAIVDVNRLGQRGPTRHEWDLDAYTARFEAFGWNAFQVDGHNVEEIDNALIASISDASKPTVVLAKTVKGKGAPSVEDQNGFHGKPLDDSDQVIELLANNATDARLTVKSPSVDEVPHRFPLPDPGKFERPSYQAGEEMATRDAYGEAIAYLGAQDSRIVALDAEVSNSTRAEDFEAAHPQRFFEMHIAEQQMIGTATGLQATGWKPFCSTFACFLTRAYDFLRMAAVSRADLRIAGSHAGVSIGEDGPSQMGLEDIAMMRSIHGSTVLSPCDANQTVALLEMMSEQNGISYIRTLRPSTSVIYEDGTDFEIGGSRSWGSSPADITIIATGITVHEALKAQKELDDSGISCRVIDAYSIKPIDRTAVLKASAESRWIITVEDHRPEGGLGDAVLDVLGENEDSPRVRKLAVRNMPASASGSDQLREAGIDAKTIVETGTRLASAAEAQTVSG